MTDYIPYQSDIGSYSLDKHEKLNAAIIEVNKPLIEARLSCYQDNCRDLPLVGEFYLDTDGKQNRFTHSWDKGIQGGGIGGSFYFTDDGYCSYSGGLSSSIPYINLVLTNEIREGTVWSFDRNIRQAHNGIHYKIPFRVWKIIG